jgi:hypothetical protein
MKTRSTIYFVGGGKGGVGKTMVAIALVDFLLNKTENNPVTLIESDDSNPDAYKAYESTPEVTKKVINLDAQTGWIKLMNSMPEWEKSGEQVVINSAARSTSAVEQNINDLLAGAMELGIDVRMVWVINRQRDSLILINTLLKTTNVDTTIVKNLYFGEAEKFALFDKSELKKKVKTIEFPDLNDEVADKIYIERLALNALDKFQFGERIAIQRFRSLAGVQFSNIQ